MKLLVDVNLSPRWTAFLAARGFEATHWSSLGPLNASDSTLMSYAAEHGFVIVTHDLDFSAILAASGSHRPSVVQVRADDLSPEAIGEQLVAALRQTTSELLAGALISVDARHARLRLLPLRRDSA